MISGLTLIEYLKHRFLQLHNRAGGRSDEEQRPKQKQLGPLIVSNSRYPLGRLLGPSSIRRNLQRATDRRRPTTGRCISPHDAAVVRRVDILFLLLLSLPLGQHALYACARVCVRECVHTMHSTGTARYAVHHHSARKSSLVVTSGEPGIRTMNELVRVIAPTYHDLSGANPVR